MSLSTVENIFHIYYTLYENIFQCEEELLLTLIVPFIEQQLSELRGKERTLAQYILANPETVIHMSISELAKKSGASTATITRFSRRLQCNGFPDLKMKLSTDLSHNSKIGVYQDIVQGNPLSKIVSAIEANHLRSISDTTKLIDMQHLSLAIDRLNQARKIDIYGVATSGVIAQDFYQKLIRIGKMATAFDDSHMQITSASSLNESDVAIGISYSGETCEIIDALRCAKQNGAFTISLTKLGKSTLSTEADVALFSSSLEAGMRRGDMASRIAQLHMIDILFTGMITREFDPYVSNLEQSYQMVKFYRKEKRG